MKPALVAKPGVALLLAIHPVASAQARWFSPQLGSEMREVHASFLAADGTRFARAARRAFTSPTLSLQERRNVRDLVRRALEIPGLAPAPRLDVFLKFSDLSCERRPQGIACPSELGTAVLHTSSPEEWLEVPLGSGKSFPLRTQDLSFDVAFPHERRFGSTLHFVVRDEPGRKRSWEAMMVRVLLHEQPQSPRQQILTAWKMEPGRLCPIARISPTEPMGYEDLEATIRLLAEGFACGDAELTLE